MALTRERLDAIAAEYHTAEVEDKFIEDALQRHSLDWIDVELGRCRRVLELGHGEGIVTDHLVKSGKQVTLLEGAARLVSRARETYGDRIEVIHGLFEDFTPVTRYDAIVAGHVLEHVDAPVTLLRRMRRWLKPGGRLLVIVPNSESIHRRLAVLMGLQPQLDTLSPRDHLVGHQRVYSLGELTRDLRRGGFVPRRTRGFFFKPLSNGLMLGFSPALIDAMNVIAHDLPAEWLSNLGVSAVPARAASASKRQSRAGAPPPKKKLPPNSRSSATIPSPKASKTRKTTATSATRSGQGTARRKRGKGSRSTDRR